MPIPVAFTPVAPFITNDPESASIPVLLIVKLLTVTLLFDTKFVALAVPLTVNC